MLKFFRSKLFISIILLLMAAILTFAFLPKLYGSQNTTMTVVQFINDVNLGTKISEDMLVTKTIGQYGVSPLSLLRLKSSESMPPTISGTIPTCTATCSLTTGTRSTVSLIPC